MLILVWLLFENGNNDNEDCRSMIQIRIGIVLVITIVSMNRKWIFAVRNKKVECKVSGLCFRFYAILKKIMDPEICDSRKLCFGI